MKFVVATMSLLVLVFVMGGTIVVVAGVLTPKVITAAVNWTAAPRFEAADRMELPRSLMGTGPLDSAGTGWEGPSTEAGGRRAFGDRTIGRDQPSVGLRDTDRPDLAGVHIATVNRAEAAGAELASAQPANLQKILDALERAGVAANPSLFRISLLCGKIQGNFGARGLAMVKLPSH
jgi:hypothetical protein